MDTEVSLVESQDSWKALGDAAHLRLACLRRFDHRQSHNVIINLLLRRRPGISGLLLDLSSFD
jgi:hypothetical protein